MSRNARQRLPPGSKQARRPHRAHRRKRRPRPPGGPAQPARGRRRDRGRQGLPRPGEAEGHRPDAGEPRQAPGRDPPGGGERDLHQDLPRRARGDDGLRRRAHRLGVQRADRHHDGRPPGLGKDDDLRQAREAPRREAEEEAAPRRRRHAAPRRRRAAQGARRSAQDPRLQLLPGESPVAILRAAARAEAKKQGRDVIIYDTAGRLAIDELLMARARRDQGPDLTRVNLSSSWSTP